MGLGKALGFSLLAYIGMNFLFEIIVRTLDGTLNALFSTITGNPLYIFVIIFSPIVMLPGFVINTLSTQITTMSFDASLIQSIGLLVSPFIASLVAGRTGSGKGGSFGGWMLTAVISAISLIILAYIQSLVPIAWFIQYGISGVVNGIFYGCFALLFSKNEMY